MNLSDPTIQMLTLIVPMGAIFYFLIIRPQSQRMKDLKRMVESLRRGDTVVTAGGIVGKVVKATASDDAEILIEIADNVQVKVIKSTLTSVTAKGQPAES